MNDRTASGFENAYREHYGAVRRYAATRFGEDDADDIAQETMLRAWAKFDEISRDGRPLSGWLTKVATDVGIDRRRRQQRTVVDGETVQHATASVPDESARVALQADTRPLLKRALLRLTPGERYALGLHAVADAGIGEIAAATGMTANAVRQRLFRARRNLRHHYSQLGGHDYASLGPLVGASQRVAEPSRGTWLTRIADRLAGLPNALPSGSAKPAVAVTVLVTLIVPPGLSRVPVRVAPKMPGVESPSPGRVSLPGLRPVGNARSAVREVASGLLGVVGATGADQAFRVEAESAPIDQQRCGDDFATRQPMPGASGGLAVVEPASCWSSFTTTDRQRVASIRYRASGSDVCGHFEITGEITGESISICLATGTWVLVPVRSSSGIGAYDVTWVADGNRHAVDVDYHTLAPDGVDAAVARCSNGGDDDADGLADSKDSACAGLLDDDERSYGECDDGLDNDGDGWADYPEDNGCTGWDGVEYCVPRVSERHKDDSTALDGRYRDVERTVTCVSTSRKPLSLQLRNVPAAVLPEGK